MYFILKAISLVAISRTPPVDQPFLIDFICVLLVVLWVAVSGIPSSSNLFLLILVSRFFFDWLKYLGTWFRLRTNGKYRYGWAILKTQRKRERKRERERDESKQTTEQRRKKRRKKGEELEGKGQVILEGRGTIGCYCVVSVIVGVQPLMH